MKPQSHEEHIRHTFDAFCKKVLRNEARDYENGIMDGTSGTTFAPGMLLNRAMAAQVLYNLANGAVTTSAGFPDVAASAWYADAVNWAAAQGYVTGYDNGSFGPEDSLTRE